MLDLPTAPLPTTTTLMAVSISSSLILLAAKLQPITDQSATYPSQAETTKQNINGQEKDNATCIISRSMEGLQKIGLGYENICLCSAAGYRKNIMFKIMLRGISRIQSVAEHHLTHQLSSSTVLYLKYKWKNSLQDCFCERTAGFSKARATRSWVGLWRFNNWKSCGIHDFLTKAWRLL